MIIILIYIVSAFITYIFAYKLIRKIDKKEREKLRKWEYMTLREVKAMLDEIYFELNDKSIVDFVTLGSLESYIEDRKKELVKE